MIKTLALIKRRSSIDRDAFRAHYEDVHVPLALPLLDGLLRYVRYHVVEDRWGAFAFDVLTDFGYRDKAASDRVFERLDSEEGAAITKDELCFMDKAANRFFAVSERSLLSGDEGNDHLFVLVVRPEGMTRYDASAGLVDRHWPSLLANIDGPEFALLRDGFPMQGCEQPYDSVLQVAASSFAGLEDWSRALEADGYRVDAVETRRFETRLEA